jgi:hypothetical protein
VPAIGAALDSLILLLGISSITTVLVMALAIWRGILSGNLKKSFIRRRPLFVPSLVFTISLIVAMIYVPHPMAEYHGTNQINRYSPYTGTFRVYEPGVYEEDVQVRIARNLFSNERLEVFATFSQNEIIVRTLFMNITDDDFDMYGGVTYSISLNPGRYNLIINGTLFVDGIPDNIAYIDFVVNQPVTSSFINELTVWSSIRFVLGFGMFFLLLAGVCIGGDNRRRRQRQGNQQGVKPIWSID